MVSRSKSFIARLSPNRRKARRQSTRMRVDYCPLVTHVDGYRVGGTQRGIALDISCGGLFVSQAGYLREGSTIHLCLRLPDIPANPVVCYAKVVRQEDGLRSGFGVRFLRIKESDRARLSRFVTHLHRSKSRWAAAG